MDPSREPDLGAVAEQRARARAEASGELAPQPAPGWQAWVETALLAAAALAMSAAADHDDPFLSRRAVPWLAIAPLLAGLRYGVRHGVACALGQVAALLAAAGWRGMALQGSRAELVLGWLAAGLLSGAFRDAWLRRTRQLEARAEELRLRLAGLARAYHTLKASHDRLAREAPGRPSSLRDALGAFQGESAEAGSLPALAERILAVFRDHAFILGATLHEVDREGRPGPAIASLGAASGDAGDPLLHHAARAGKVVSVRDAPKCDGVIAAVPLVDVAGRVHAVVAVRDMPFVALHAETLSLLAVLGGHFGDALSRMTRSREERRTAGSRSVLKLEAFPGPRREERAAAAAPAEAERDHGAVA